jgi:hypothetical protein
MNPTAAYLEELKAYVTERRRHIEEARQRSPDILPCPFHTFCFYEETLGHCEEWIPEPTPDYISPNYESNVSEWHRNTTDVPLLTIDELTEERDVVLTSNLRHLLGDGRNSLHEFNNRTTSPQPRASPRSLLSSTATIDNLKVPFTAHRLVDPTQHTSTHRYPLRSLDKRATIKDVPTAPRSSKLGRVTMRRERVTKKPYGRPRA